jgi:hypothetical protein
MSKPMDKSQFKHVDPPFWVAWNQAMASIRVRFFRQLITTLGIVVLRRFFVVNTSIWDAFV